MYAPINNRKDKRCQKRQKVSGNRFHCGPAKMAYSVPDALFTPTPFATLSTLTEMIPLQKPFLKRMRHFLSTMNGQQDGDPVVSRFIDRNINVDRKTAYAFTKIGASRAHQRLIGALAGRNRPSIGPTGPVPVDGRFGNYVNPTMLSQPHWPRASGLRV
jgi:hypothetical protein